VPDALNAEKKVQLIKKVPVPPAKVPAKIEQPPKGPNKPKLNMPQPQ
jgi:hypothetical protein